MRHFPSLTLFRGGRPLHLTDTNAHDPTDILKAVGAKGVLQLPGGIRKVEAEELEELTRKDSLVAAIFFDDANKSVEEEEEEEGDVKRVTGALEEVATEAEAFE